MSENQFAKQLVFGLDIGTRSIVGTVGYKEGSQFHIAAQYTKEHETRSMIDGQIHDIPKVGESIGFVRKKLEEQLDRKLTEVCIAAAGRVLKTITTYVEMEFPEDITVDSEQIYSLDLLGVEKAYNELLEQDNGNFKFYCVGYSVIKYMLNDYPIANLEDHKAKKIAEEVIATFLPEDVVDGLYKAVELAGLQVANLTLEPIAAINIAIPERFRMLNLALVDVGAGTSDICVTRDGAITAYGMIPYAGDEMTEVIAQHCLVDFQTAEQIKRDSSEQDFVEYLDIMLLPNKIPSEEIRGLLEPVLEKITESVAGKIIELNGGKPVSAVFIVGGGGKVRGFAERIAEKLEIPKERVALRGEEVMADIIFHQEGMKKDPLLVTPVGICLNFYDQKNNFIFVNFNGERVKLYDNDKLSIVDAAMQAGFSNEALFPRRGEALQFSVDGKQRMIRGELGEPAVVLLNGEPANIGSKIEQNDRIVIQESTVGAPAVCELGDLEEFGKNIIFFVNGQKVECPKFAKVNGELASAYYNIRQGDEIQMLKYYTVKQIADFMDVIIEEDSVFVNNEIAGFEDEVYENFSVKWKLLQEIQPEPEQKEKPRQEVKVDILDVLEKELEQNFEKPEISVVPKEPGTIQIIVNGTVMQLSGKDAYSFIDAFDAFGFDVSNPEGKELITLRNGERVGFTDRIHMGDQIEIFWK